MSRRTAELLAAAERNWPWYVLAWIFPLAFLVYAAVERSLNRSLLVETILGVAFLVGFFLAQVPRFLDKATFYETTVLGVLVPFLIWAIGAFASSLLFVMLGIA